MALFSLNWQTYKILYPLLFPLFILFRQICSDNIPVIKNSKITDNLFMMTTFMFFSEMICGILEPLRMWLSKRKMNTKTHTITMHQKTKIIDYLEEWIKRSGNVIVEIIAILVIASLDYGGFIIIELPNYLTKHKEELGTYTNEELFFVNDLSATLRMTEIVFLSILTTHVFGYMIYKHHTFSRLIQTISIVILVVLFFILVLCYEWYESKQYWLYLLSVLTFSFSFFLYSCKNICIKWMIEKRFYSPFLLIFYAGLAGLLLMVITFVIINTAITTSNCHFAICIGNMGDFFSNLGDDGKTLGLLIGIFICGAIINMFQYLTNQYFNPCYIGIGDSITGFILFIYFLISSPDNNLSYINNYIYWILIVICGIIYLISVFSCLVYTENIVCYFANLNENVTSEIMKRAKNDIVISQEVLNHEISLIERPSERVTNNQEEEDELAQ